MRDSILARKRAAAAAGARGNTVDDATHAADGAHLPATPDVELAVLVAPRRHGHGCVHHDYISATPKFIKLCDGNTAVLNRPGVAGLRLSPRSRARR